MFSFGPDVLYETWCRNADLIFQNASTTAFPPGVGLRDTGARGWFGRRHPVSSAGGPLRGVGEDGNSDSREGGATKGQETSGKITTYWFSAASRL
ncbi:hypothetical protein B0I37DRAFT_237522 [Chaetomium sp. MPI-CAGE-AT-0009]|nr:hypothetical protein B0I37DRAFT_237522 [Chaetomium sp. MPI-CAGE-AT-0009]